MTESECIAFNEFGRQIKSLKLQDAAALEVQKKATEEWKVINLQLTEKMKDFDNFISSCKNAATSIS